MGIFLARRRYNMQRVGFKVKAAVFAERRIRSKESERERERERENKPSQLK